MPRIDRVWFGFPRWGCPGDAHCVLAIALDADRALPCPFEIHGILEGSRTKKGEGEWTRVRGCYLDFGVQYFHTFVFVVEEFSHLSAFILLVALSSETLFCTFASRGGRARMRWRMMTKVFERTAEELNSISLGRLAVFLSGFSRFSFAIPFFVCSASPRWRSSPDRRSVVYHDFVGYWPIRT